MITPWCALNAIIPFEWICFLCRSTIRNLKELPWFVQDPWCNFSSNVCIFSKINVSHTVIFLNGEEKAREGRVDVVNMVIRSKVRNIFFQLRTAPSVGVAIIHGLVLFHRKKISKTVDRWEQMINKNYCTDNRVRKLTLQAWAFWAFAHQ